MHQFLSYQKFHAINKISWNTVDDMIPVGSIFHVVDYDSNESFEVKRTAGSLHADVEPLTKYDYDIIKELYDTPESFESSKFHSVYISYNGFKIAAAFMAFPHAGSLKTKPGTTTRNLTGGFKDILNGNHIQDNGPIGHYCLHFPDSLKHTDDQPDFSAMSAINRIK